jgi:hypothetical protein
MRGFGTRSTPKSDTSTAYTKEHSLFRATFFRQASVAYCWRPLSPFLQPQGQMRRGSSLTLDFRVLAGSLRIALRLSGVWHPVRRSKAASDHPRR